MKKRVLSLFVAAVMLVGLVMPLGASSVLDTNAANYDLGDLSMDGVVNTTDARCILQVSLSKYQGNRNVDSLTDEEFWLSDVNRDTEVNTTDARLVLQYAVGKLTAFPDLGGGIKDPVGPQLKNTFLPTDEAAGTSFATLSDVKGNAPSEVTDTTKAFGYFALTTEQNPGLPFNVACHVTDTAITAMLPSGVDISALLVDYTYYGDKVLYNGAAITADTAFDFTSPVTLTMVARDGSTQDVTVNIERLSTGLPSMAVTLENYVGVDNIQKEVYTKATFYLGGGDASVCDYAAAEPQLMTGTIKGRGNSSWLLDEKKSYTVKLDKKAKLLDMDTSKNWAIVGNYEDKSLMRNTMAAYFAEAVEMPYVMMARPVDMWIDGQYWGTYNLTQKIEIEGERVSITDTEKPGDEKFTDPAANEVGYLLEFDAHVTEANAGGLLDNVQSLDPNNWADYGWSRWEYPYTDLYDKENPNKTGYVYYNPDTDETFFQLNYCNGKWVTVKKPSTENLAHNEEMRKYIFQKVMELDSALRNRNHDPNKMQELLDIDSFARWIIVEELMDNTDASFHSSVYMSLDVNGKFVFGSLWDFDRSSGNCSYWTNNVGSLIGGTDWGRYVFSTAAGKAALKNAWNEFKTNTADWEDVLWEQYDMLCPSATCNFEKWDILGTYVYYNSDLTGTKLPSFELQVDYLNRWLRFRYRDLDAYIAQQVAQ